MKTLDTSACSKTPAANRFAAVLLLLLSSFSAAVAGSATWKSSPATGDWNTASNWSPETVPNGSSDVAAFATSNVTGVSVSDFTVVNSIVFNPGASAFVIGVNANDVLRFDGAGIINNSGVTQNFVVKFEPHGAVGLIAFGNSATVGANTTFTTDAPTDLGEPPGILFTGYSSAGDGTFITLANPISGNDGGEIFFDDYSTAGNGTFTINGGSASGAAGGFVLFNSAATAGNATLIINGGTVSGASGSQLSFSHLSGAARAESSTLIANGGLNGAEGGTIQFDKHSRGGKARVEVFGNGYLDISGHYAPGVSIGSLEGDGLVFLGSNSLTVGKNDVSTTFSGVMQDGGPNSSQIGGSLTKIGGGTLTISNANLYSGGTFVAGGHSGELTVANTTGSATGTGPVQVSRGRLSGTGSISGAVTVGAGEATTNTPVINAQIGTLTVNNTVTFNAYSGFKCHVNRDNATAAQLKAVGVTINPNTSFILVEGGTTALTSGTAFTVINNSSAHPILGRFDNLPDGGSIMSANGTVYKANYSGGTGNDLTLTVE